MNAMTYKGYQANVEYDAEAELFHGEVVNTRDVITFQGGSVDALKAALADSQRWRPEPTQPTRRTDTRCR